MVNAQDIPSPDGRKSRSEKSRQQILQAFSTLIAHGVLSPTAEQVSEQAGVGLRTVFRHFDDMDSIYREMRMGVESEIAAVLAQPLQGDTWQEKLMHALQRRSRTYEKLMPVQLASQIKRHESTYIQAQMEHSRQLQRTLLKSFLPAAVVKDKTLFESLDMLLSIDTWIRLRKEQNLSTAMAEKTLSRTLLALLNTLQR